MITNLTTLDTSPEIVIADLFCSAGGSAMGLYQAFSPHYDVLIVGVDVKHQPRYPSFHGKPYSKHFQFIQADALTFDLSGYGFIWASPPCQAYTPMLNHGLTDRAKHPDLIAATRKRLAGVPHIIENVQGSPLQNAVMLCGEMFSLRVTRHRLFESNIPLFAPPHPKHRGKGHRKQGDGGYYFRVYGHETGKRQWGEAMGIPWMRSQELAQAIPPKFSEYLGRQIMNQCFQRAA